ncbi:MAG TPA: hypothetical protein VGF16_08080 [Bryobacteraceae bacterium]|jgi:hypothetical protein
MKKLLLTGVLCLAGLTVLSAKSYDIVLSTPTKVGTAQLKPGQYRLKVEGTKATFTQVDTDKSVTTDVKVQTNEKKFDQTKVDTTKDGDVQKIQDIELGGSNTRIEF